MVVFNLCLCIIFSVFFLINLVRKSTIFFLAGEREVRLMVQNLAIILICQCGIFGIFGKCCIFCKYCLFYLFVIPKLFGRVIVIIAFIVVIVVIVFVERVFPIGVFEI